MGLSPKTFPFILICLAVRTRTLSSLHSRSKESVELEEKWTMPKLKDLSGITFPLPSSYNPAIQHSQMKRSTGSVPEQSPERCQVMIHEHIERMRSVLKTRHTYPPKFALQFGTFLPVIPISLSSQHPLRAVLLVVGFSMCVASGRKNKDNIGK